MTTAKEAWAYINEEAKEQFYIWEEAEGHTHLSDADRALWCDAYIWGVTKVLMEQIKAEMESD